MDFNPALKLINITLAYENDQNGPSLAKWHVQTSFYAEHVSWDS